MPYIHSTRFVLLALSLLSACAASGPAPHGATSDPKAPVADVPVTGSTGQILAARFAESQNDLNYAADQFLRALANDPHSPDLLQQAFLTCLLAGRPEALTLARMQPDVQAAQLLVADSEATSGNWEKAESLYGALPKQGLTQVLQPLLVAWAQQGGGRTDAALATLNPYVESSRFKGIYALHAALIADMAKRNAEAARLYRLAQADFGTTNLELAREVASWQNRQGFPADAAKTLEALADADPEFAVAMPALKADAAHPQLHRPADGIAEAYLALAAALSSQDNSDFSLVLVQLALRLRPDLTAARLLAADILDARQHPGASLLMLAPVAADDPLDPVVRVRRVALLDRTGQSEEALRQLSQLAKDFPNNPQPPTMEGDILREKSRFADAAAAYDRAIALVPHPQRTDWPLFYDRGIALERSHNWPRAEADFQRALELSPEQPFVLNYLGYSWAEQGRNLAKARQMIQRALEERPNDGAIVDSLGWVMLKQGDVAGAIANLEHAVELEPEDATINGHLGDAYAAAGRKLEAQYQWRLALSFKPEPDEVPKLQAKLREGEQANGAAAAPSAAALPTKATP
jgi:tetratricopeptide (TPR) repeat protein